MEDSPQRVSGCEHPGSEPGGEPGPSAALGRRKFLVRAAAAGTVAWAVPAIVTMEPAGAAALTSPPPEVEVLPNRVTDPGEPGGPAVEVAAAKPPAKPKVEVLAKTGAPIDTLFGLGAVAVAGGGALHQWSAATARRAAAAAPEVPEVPEG